MKKSLAYGGLTLAAAVMLAAAYFHTAVLSVYLNLVEVTQFEVIGTELHMDGLINSQTPEQIRSVFAEHPAISTIVLHNVPGSVDDDANLEISSWLAQKTLTTVLKSDSVVASGGTDFFLVGDIRIVEDGARIGVHSWGDGFSNSTATDFPVGHAHHLPYIEFYTRIGFSREKAEKFYYFTINAAPADDIHWMTPEEIRVYSIATP